MLQDYARAALLLAGLWSLCAFAHPTVRRSLLEGARCLSRYPDLWWLPAWCGFSYAIFQILAGALLQWRLQENLFAWLTACTWEAPPAPLFLFGSSVLPAAEKTAAAFTIFTATFPLSALCALLLICNHRGLLAEMFKALRRRLGRGLGLITVLLLLLSALCALAKPAVYLLLPEIIDHSPVVLPMGISLLSVPFELLLGIFFLTYLMLMAYAWRRGLHVERHKLLHLAMRRVGFVLKWSTAIAALEIGLVLLPLYAGLLLGAGSDFFDACSWFSNIIGRSLVTVVALIYCPVQAILVFHNESLRHALRDSVRIWRAHGLALALFLIAVLLSFLVLECAESFASFRLGAETAATLGTHFLAAGVEALLTGWFIASWICLYKNFSTSRKEILL